MAGWNRPGEAPKKAAKRPSPVRGVVAGALVVALAAGAYFAFFAGTGEKPQKAVKEKSPSAIKEVTPAPAPKAKAAEKPAPKPKKKWDVISCSTNTDSGVIYERVRLPDGSTMTVQHKPDPVFSNLCDNVIAMIICSEGGNIPPLPPIDEERLRESFIQSVASPVRVASSDSEKVAAMKLAVQEYRQAIAENISAGDSRSVLAMIQDHVRETNEKFSLKAEAIKQVHAACADSDAEFQAEYVKKVNAYLEKYGVSPIETDNSGETERKTR